MGWYYDASGRTYRIRFPFDIIVRDNYRPVTIRYTNSTEPHTNTFMLIRIRCME